MGLAGTEARTKEGADGPSLNAQFGVQQFWALSYTSALPMQQSHPSLLSLWPPALGWPQGWHSPAQEVAKPWAEKQQLQQRALFVKMEPVCASVPVSRLACPAALS